MMLIFILEIFAAAVILIGLLAIALEFDMQKQLKKKEDSIDKPIYSRSERRMVRDAFGSIAGDWALGASTRIVNAANRSERLAEKEALVKDFRTYQFCPRCDLFDCHWLEVTQKQTLRIGKEDVTKGILFRTCKGCGYSWQLSDRYEYKTKPKR